MNYGEFLLRYEQTEKAIEQYQLALHYDRHNADIYYNLGVVSLDSKDPEKALNYFNLALNIDPKHKVSVALINIRYSTYKMS